MTKGTHVDTRTGVRVTVSVGPSAAGAWHDYFARVETEEGLVRMKAGSAPTYRAAWNEVLALVEQEAMR